MTVTDQINPFMATPKRNWTLFTEIKFCTLCLTIISCFEKIFLWRIGKVGNLPSHIRDTGHMDFKLQKYCGNVNFNVGYT